METRSKVPIWAKNQVICLFLQIVSLIFFVFVSMMLHSEIEVFYNCYRHSGFSHCYTNFNSFISSILLISFFSFIYFISCSFIYISFISYSSCFILLVNVIYYRGSIAQCACFHFLFTRFFYKKPVYKKPTTRTFKILETLRTTF